MRRLWWINLDGNPSRHRSLATILSYPTKSFIGTFILYENTSISQYHPKKILFIYMKNVDISNIYAKRRLFSEIGENSSESLRLYQGFRTGFCRSWSQDWRKVDPKPEMANGWSGSRSLYWQLVGAWAGARRKVRIGSWTDPNIPSSGIEI